jgi:MFS family permease
MHRLIDVHAASCAGDVLVAIALAGTIFFNVGVGEARSHVAVYLLVTMTPFALLSPVIGPVLDRFQHGRRFALATTLLARAFLAFAISDRMTSWVLYPAAFGVLVMSRSYGVARSAAVPRLLPAGMSLVSANARGSLAGTVAAIVIAPVGLLLAHIGPQWTLRMAILVFLTGMVVALRLPSRADSDPPERLPHPLPWRTDRARVLTGARVWAALTSAACFRALYGFLTLFFAFRTRVDHFGVPGTVALGVIGAGLALGSFSGTVVGTRLQLRNPLIPQFAGLTAVVVATAVTSASYALVTAVIVALVCAVGSAVAKLALDSVLQQDLPEAVRGSGFAHSESVLQLAFVFGGAVGLIPLGGPWGLLVAAAIALGGATQVGLAIWQTRSGGAGPAVVDVRDRAASQP